MKRYELNWDKIKIYIIIASFIAFGGYVFSTVKKMKSAEPDAPDITTDVLLSGNGEYSNGYTHGSIISIEGKEISCDVDIDIGSYKVTRHAGISEFTPVLGIAGFGSSGLINQCDVTLHSSSRKVNVELREGNSIQTTFSYKAQCVASSLLKQYFSPDVCDGASLAVVLKDGTVIVAAGSNSYSADEFNLNQETGNFPKDMCIDKTVSNYSVGSVAKTFTASALLLNDKYVNKEYSLYNEQFEDLSFFEHGGHTIQNHDHSDTEAYELVVNPENNQMMRHIGLDYAFIYSSNTYFWRHALNFGLDKTFNAINRLFSVTQPIRTEINTLTVLEVDPERYDYLFFGQDWLSNQVVVSCMYNTIFSGEKYNPFYITSVYTPDGAEVYRANPQKTETIPFDDRMKSILSDSLSKCFKSYCENMDTFEYEKYNYLIEDNRILAKSGTADVIEDKITNNTRVMTLLDENHDVICTAAIGVNRAENDKCTVNDDILFSIIFNTLEAAGIL